MIKYQYVKIINSDKLILELESLSPIYIETIEPDTLNIYFDLELSVEDKSILDTIVEAHDHSVVAVIPDVTPRQIRQALILSGVTVEQIETALDTLEEPTRSLARVEWEYSVAFQRNRPLVTQVGVMLGWTSEQLDDLWLLAESL